MGKGIGIGLVVLPSNLLNSRLESLNIGKSNLVYNGELEGITKVFKYTSKNIEKNYKYYIHSNN